MPPYPVPKWMQWQMKVLPQVITNFMRPFYLRPSNNLPGPVPKRESKPAVIQHVPKQTKREALVQASTGTVIPTGLKVTDG
jgi:hypothetical protein